MDVFADADLLLRELGSIDQGRMFNTLARAMELAGVGDGIGGLDLPTLVLNVTYPLVPAEIVQFCAGKRAMLIVEEGQPAFLEDAIAATLRRADVNASIMGKGTFPVAGEYTDAVVKAGLDVFLAEYGGELYLCPLLHQRCR